MSPSDPLAVLQDSLRGSPIIWKGEYPYFIHPISDGIPRMDADVLRATRDLIVEMVDWSNIDLIVSVRLWDCRFWRRSGMPLASQRW